MQSPIIHQQLILSTERLRDLHRLMQAHSAAIPTGEMEVFLAEIRKVYELALHLNYQNSLQLLNEIPLAVATDPKINEVSVPVVNEPIRKEDVSDAPIEVPGTKHSAISMDKLMSDISKADTTTELNQQKKSNSDLHEMFESAPSIAHNFEDHETLADRMASNQISHSVSDHLHKIPVKDIKATIGLNEKFQFINQLFNGDSQKYNASVDVLNSCGSSSRAQDFMKNISQEYNWEKQPSIASLFMDIVERRFLG